MKRRVVIAGFGDTGLLVAIHLGREFEIVGISPKPCLVSGQELGARLTRPEEWKRDYLLAYSQFEKLDHVEIVQGLTQAIDPVARRVAVALSDGAERSYAYDVLVIAAGVTNGFWRTNGFEEAARIEREIARRAERLAGADCIAVVGGGATGVSVAANLAETYPQKSVHLFHGGEQPLPGYHEKVRARLVAELQRQGVRLHSKHRAEIPEGFDCDEFTTETLTWSTGQPPFDADLVVWAVGRARPNSGFVPAELLDASGYVLAEATLQVPGHADIFVVGDIAASDPNRSSARNWGYRLVAHNIRALLRGNEAAMKRYDPPRRRWGSILGVQKNGLRVFQPDGGSFRFPRWSVRRLLFPLAVRRGIYKGIRSNPRD